MPLPADHAARRRDDRLAQARRLTLCVAGGATAASLALGGAFAHALPGHRASTTAAQLPELVELDEWGFPVLHADAVGPDLLPHARRAVSACPTLALRLLRTRASGPASQR